MKGGKLKATYTRDVESSPIQSHSIGVSPLLYRIEYVELFLRG